MAEEFAAFEDALRKASFRLATTPARICTASGAKFGTNISLARADGRPNEQFYKWQLINALIKTRRIPAEHIGAELQIPRGSLRSTDLYVDVVIFSTPEWKAIYDSLAAGQRDHDWGELYALVVGCGEIKDDPADDPERTISRQLMPALNATSRSYSLGFYHNAGHLVLVARSTDEVGTSTTRMDPMRQGSSGTALTRLDPSIPDSWQAFPTLQMILTRGAGGLNGSRAGRTADDLDVMSSRSQRPIEAALDAITRVLDATSLRAELGYRIVIETLAAKEFDEGRSELEFYVDPGEVPSISAGQITGKVGQFRDRLKRLHDAARPKYPSILHHSVIEWNNPAHLRVIAEVVTGFQDISLRRSEQGDLYQLVFYNFAGPLSKIQQAQFMTPLQVIEFMVKVVNPQPQEQIFDPTAGIADFLSVSFTRGRHNKAALSATDLFGADNDPNMTMLAGLNMLLNGDGSAHLHTIPDTGSLDHKLVRHVPTGDVRPERLDPTLNHGGRWDPAPGSGLEAMKFDVVLTNPPFGDGRALKLDNAENRAIATLYEIAACMGGNQIDKGLLFLENAFRVLKEPGRLGIVLSTAIAGVAEYQAARDWLYANARVVAVVDLPANIFAETGVPTTLLFAYKTSPERLSELQAQPYEIFLRTVEHVGYTKVTRSRTTLLVDRFKLDPDTGLAVHDASSGAPVLDEEFSVTVDEFRSWAATQEMELQNQFLR
jgi:type I restriction enzyme M protein